MKFFIDHLALSVVLILLLSLGLNSLAMDFGVPGQPSWTANPIRLFDVENYGLTIQDHYGPLCFSVARLACFIADSVVHDPEYREWNWIIALRAMNILFCTACVLVLMLITLITHSRLVALQSGFICACAPAVVFWAKSESVNPLVTLLLMLTILAAVHLLRSSRPQALLWIVCGVLAGLTISAKETYWGILAALPVVYILNCWRHDWPLSRIVFQGLPWSVLYVALAVVIYFKFTFSEPELLNVRISHYLGPIQGSEPAPVMNLLELLGVIGQKMLTWLFVVPLTALSGLFFNPFSYFFGLIGLAASIRGSSFGRWTPLLLAYVTTWLMSILLLWRDNLPQDVLPLALCLSPLVALGISTVFGWRRLPVWAARTGIGAVYTLILLFGLLVNLNMIYNPRYDLLELGRDDDRRHSVIFAVQRENREPALPKHWSRVEDVNQADMLVVELNSYNKQESLLRLPFPIEDSGDEQWCPMQRLDTPSLLGFLFPNYNISYLVMERRRECPELQSGTQQVQ
ncbi:MAG: DUF2142 domain-containing protein [Candidatus Alcyoniella australis]|nr:DUF2142 domain-containing protein [Candidatus Alcyoniella australis]